MMMQTVTVIPNVYEPLEYANCLRAYPVLTVTYEMGIVHPHFTAAEIRTERLTNLPEITQLHVTEQMIQKSVPLTLSSGTSLLPSLLLSILFLLIFVPSTCDRI